MTYEYEDEHTDLDPVGSSQTNLSEAQYRSKPVVVVEPDKYIVSRFS